jgi:hypothetical protein
MGDDVAGASYHLLADAWPCPNVSCEPAQMRGSIAAGHLTLDVPLLEAVQIYHPSVFIDRTTIDQFHPKLEPVQFTICTFAHRTTLDPWGLVPLGQSQLDTRGVPSPRPPE